MLRPENDDGDHASKFLATSNGAPCSSAAPVDIAAEAKRIIKRVRKEAAHHRPAATKWRAIGESSCRSGGGHEETDSNLND